MSKKGKVIGRISDNEASKWHVPEYSNKLIYEFSGIDHHTKKHFGEFRLGEKSKNYTMTHLRNVLSDAEYVCFNTKHLSFEYHKKLMEYVTVTVKQMEDNDNFCVSSIFPSSESKMNIRKNNETKTINKIDKLKNQGKIS